jgi:hypothetical protein
MGRITVRQREKEAEADGILRRQRTKIHGMKVGGGKSRRREFAR